MDQARTVEDPRDNPVWHALLGPQAGLAEASPADAPDEASAPPVLRYDPEVAPFWAAERVDEAAWAALARRAGPGGLVVLMRDRVPPPGAGWQARFRATGLQLEAGELAPRVPVDFVELGPDDAAEMLALAELTEPGPFLEGTRRLGRYVGVRRQGRLVAMAGERFHPPGHVEVSAVCTHPEARGQGLGGALTLEIAHAIHERGERAFLHVVEGNDGALRLYRKLGFAERRRVEVLAALWRDDGLPPEAPREDEAGGAAGPRFLHPR